MNEAVRTEIEAGVFRRLTEHLRQHPEAQNIDLMILAAFCRNCLAKWYRAEAEARGVALDYPAAQEIVYGMSYDEWKRKHQAEATPEQLAAFEEVQKKRAAAGEM
ncbi:MAG TPA: DUF1244 domain-containing protein [Methylococcaceae bacterium]|nr:DUF1244 domain-containing protein [Methylococcaceae bacterium]